MIGISLDIPEVAVRGGSRFPSWLPLASGAAPTLFADFTTEGTTNHYWAAAAQQANYAAWKSAASITHTRATNATYTQGGVVQTASSGVLRFPTDGSSVALGARFSGAQVELCIQNRDLTNVAWTATTATVAKDQTGADGVLNSASSILATAGNATVLQSITSGSANRLSGAYVKRLTGSGVINMTQDNGGTWTPIAVTAAWTFFTIPAATTTNPILGFQIVTNADAIAVDFVSHRAGAGLTFIADVIATTTVSVTQNIDAFSIPFAGGTAFTAMVKAQGLSITNGTNAAYLDSVQNVADIVMYTPAGTKVNVRTLNQVNTLDATAFPASGDVTGVHKTALSGNASARSFSSDGQPATSDAHAIVGTSMTSIFLGAESNSTASIFGQIQQIGLWAGVSGADVAALSTLP